MGKKKKPVWMKPLSWLENRFFNLAMKMPEIIIRWLVEIVGWIYSRFGFRWKQRAMENIRRVYQDRMADKDIRALARESMKNLVRVTGEIVIIARNVSFAFEDTVIDGEQHLQRALKTGRGVIVLGSHVGNFIFLIAALTHMGYQITYMFKEANDPVFRDFLWRLKKRLDLSPIPLHPRREAVKRALIALKNKEILWLAADQDARKGSIGVEFFGVKVATAQGPAVLAQKTGAVVLPMYTERRDWLKHRIIIKPPIEMVTTGDKEEDKYTNLRKMNAVLEEIILTHPREWFWVHRRWKRAGRYATGAGRLHPEK